MHGLLHRRAFLVVVTTLCAVMTLCSVHGSEARRPLQEGNSGIGSRYPGDVGIARDKAVVFVEDFEAGSVANLNKSWENIANREILSFSKDIPAGSAGQQSLLVTHVGGKSTGAHLYRRLQPGCEQLHFRFYVKFDPKCAPIHVSAAAGQLL